MTDLHPWASLSCDARPDPTTEADPMPTPDPTSGPAAHPRCPYCARILGAHDGASPDRQPKDGDAFVCLRCLGVGIFVVSPLLGLRVRAATAEELIERRPQTSKVINAVIDGRARGITSAEGIVSAWRGAGAPGALASPRDDA